MMLLSGALLITVPGALYVGIYAFRNFDREPAKPLVLSVVAIIIWVIGYAFELSSTSLSTVLFWANLQFVGISLAPVCWLETTRRILGKSRMPLPMVGALLIIPVISLVFLGTGADVFRGEPELYESMGALLLDPDYGWFHNGVFVTFQYVLYGFTFFLILHSWQRAHPAFRRGYFLLLFGMVLPLLGSVLYVLNISPFEIFNPTPVLLIITVYTYAFVFRNRRILDIRPIAREQVLDHLNEGVIVLDVEDRLVDFNQSAVGLFPELTNSAIGQPLREVLPQQIPLLLLAEGVQESGSGFEIEGGSERRFCYASVGDIRNGSERLLGRTLSIQDITDYVSLMQSR